MSQDLIKESEIVLYKTDEGNVNVSIIIKDETIWITQKGMAQLFDCSSDNISAHLKNIFLENELNITKTPSLEVK